MKLYTRTHLWLSALGSAALVLFAVGAWALWPRPAETPALLADHAEFEIEGRSIEPFPLQVVPIQNVPNLASLEFTPEEQQNIRLYEALNPGVVNITTQTVAYNWFLEPVPQSGGSGSGSIIDQRGYVLTNNHVVEGATKVFVNLADGSQYEGTVVGTDPENDLAVVQFDPQGKLLTTIPFGSSAPLRVGQRVLSIGNPFGLERTLTTGIVSALGRPIQSPKGLVMQNMIQTDASINPGNSGGPLLNTQGQMVGISTMIFSPSGGSVGLGFAVPVDTARRVVPELIQFGTVRRGWIDMVPVQLFPALVQAARIPISKGVLVSRVNEDSSAARAGLRGGQRTQAVRYGRSIIYLGGDIIIEANGRRVESLGDLYAALEATKPGDRIPVTVVRGRERVSLTLPLIERPKQFTVD